jgi:hypothetical protein
MNSEFLGSRVHGLIETVPSLRSLLTLSVVSHLVPGPSLFKSHLFVI